MIIIRDLDHFDDFWHANKDELVELYGSIEHFLYRLRKGPITMGGGAAPLFTVRFAAQHYKLPDHMTWRDVVTMRVKWDISERFYPVAIAPGCIAWGRPMDGGRALNTSEIE